MAQPENEKTENTAAAKGRVLSGMRPTGRLHLGNYVGALQNWVGLQNQYECFFFVADWHALTTDYADPSAVKTNSIEVATDWLAAGLDPERSVLFVQSHVPQHAELHLLFSMITPLGWLERVPSYKEQQVHVELTREIARRFNQFYMLNDREVLPEPKVLLTPSPKLPGTDGRKMSKSYGNTIQLTDPEPVVRLKLKTMVTDPARVRRTDAGDPDKCPVGDLHKVFSTAETMAKVYDGCRSAGIGCIECKGWAADGLVRVLQPIQERRASFSVTQVKEILDDGSRRASARAEETMRQVRAAMQMTLTSETGQ